MNGQVPVGSKAMVWCDAGYFPTGLAFATCVSHGWNRPAVTCHGW